MSGYTALVPIRPWVEDYAGRCLPYAQSFFGAPIMYDYARQSFDAAKFKHLDWFPPNDAPSLLWFDHWGTYYSYSKGVWEYVNAGHVSILVPGVGIYTSPGYGYGYEIHQTIAAIEQRFNSTYIGWTEDINGLRVLQPKAVVPPTPPAPKPEPKPKWRKIAMDRYRPAEGKRQVIQKDDTRIGLWINKDQWITVLRDAVGTYDLFLQVNVIGHGYVEIGWMVDTTDKDGKVVASRAIAATSQDITGFEPVEKKITITVPGETMTSPGKGLTNRLRPYILKSNSPKDTPVVKVAQVRYNVLQRVMV